MDTLSTISADTALASGTADFKGDCGECRKGYFTATAIGGMQPGQSATVNGNPPQNCVVANDGGTVFEIALARIAGLYSYQVRVDAQGPRGIGSGYMYLAFQDATGDVYYLRIYSSTREGHEVSFNSSNPNIVKIFWSNYSFTVKGGKANGEKPHYKVVSPVDRTS